MPWPAAHDGFVVAVGWGGIIAMADLRPVIDLAHKLAARGESPRTIRRQTGLSSYVIRLIANLPEISARMNADSERHRARDWRAKREMKRRQNA
jgi:hypothetical protein